MFCYFNVAVLEDSAQPRIIGCLFVTACRCEVATHAAMVVLWLRRHHELVNLWKRFKSLVIFLNSMFDGVFEPSFLCRVSPLRGHVWCPASARPCFPLMQIPRETLLHKSRSVVKFCDILSIHCCQLATRGFCLFFFCPVF